jgi:hypothetical protein
VIFRSNQSSARFDAVPIKPKFGAFDRRDERVFFNPALKGDSAK